MHVWNIELELVEPWIYELDRNSYVQVMLLSRCWPGEVRQSADLWWIL